MYITVSVIIFLDVNRKIVTNMMIYYVLLVIIAFYIRTMISTAVFMICFVVLFNFRYIPPFDGRRDRNMYPYVKSSCTDANGDHNAQTINK